MSVISTRHTVVPFVAGKTNPFSGQRLAKVGYKSSTDKETGEVIPPMYPSIAVSLPTISDPSNDQMLRLKSHVRGLLESAQDGIIRSLYESREGNLKEISDEDVSIDACINFLDAEATGSRLKKSSIETWFDSELSDSIFVLVAEKLGFDNPNDSQTVTIQKHVRTYREVLAMLADGRTILQPPQIRGCKTALNLVDVSSGIGQKLAARLTAMEKPALTVEMLEL